MFTSPVAERLAWSPRYARTVGDTVATVDVPVPLAPRLSAAAIRSAVTVDVMPALMFAPPPVMTTDAGVPVEEVPTRGPTYASTVLVSLAVRPTPAPLIAPIPTAIV